MGIIPVVRESEVLTGTEAEGYHAWSNQLSTSDVPYSNISGEQSLNRRFWLCGFNKAANDAHEDILKKELLSLRGTTSSGRWIKGEATTDAEALAICWKQQREPNEFIFKAYNESIIELREKQNIIDSLTKICQNYEANACDYPRHAMAEVQNALNRKKDK